MGTFSHLFLRRHLMKDKKAEEYEGLVQKGGIKQLFYPLLSGTFGSLASMFGKLALDDAFGDRAYHWFGVENQGIVIIARIVLFAFMIIFNGMMMNFFIVSLKRNGATLTAVISFALNFFLTAFNSFFFLNEHISLRWIIGSLAIISGIFLISRSKRIEKAEKL
eukprot:TRINITY_DN10856_c0_g3_i1.p1 TRINITY_DN10856_c0_g3~~TRINITY_DN10856_c0_g3_i1.p1  ORF type:complete len:164 (-),score=3.20 TRINITY_DN10856_c0_g3_i1:35-526(-)